MTADYYPPMPARERFPIGEAAALARAKPQTLRYWEEKIPALRRGISRSGGRRYYSREAVIMLRRIETLVRVESCNLAGVRRRLGAKQNGKTAAAIQSVRRDIEKIIKLL